MLFVSWVLRANVGVSLCASMGFVVSASAGRSQICFPHFSLLLCSVESSRHLGESHRQANKPLLITYQNADRISPQRTMQRFHIQSKTFHFDARSMCGQTCVCLYSLCFSTVCFSHRGRAMRPPQLRKQTGRIGLFSSNVMRNCRRLDGWQRSKGFSDPVATFSRFA